MKHYTSRNRKRILASGMVILYLISTWAAAVAWCCKLPIGQITPVLSKVVQHKMSSHGAHDGSHEHISQASIAAQQEPSDSECDEVVPIDQSVRTVQGMWVPDGHEIICVFRLAPQPVDTLSSSKPVRWVLSPPPIYHPSDFLSTIRLLL